MKLSITSFSTASSCQAATVTAKSFGGTVSSALKSSLGFLRNRRNSVVTISQIKSSTLMARYKNTKTRPIPYRIPAYPWNIIVSPSIRCVGRQENFAGNHGRVPYMGKSTYLSSIFSTAMKASLGTSTEPNWRMRFLPSFCFSRSFFLRVMSPP